jgi:hypothetical protein
LSGRRKRRKTWRAFKRKIKKVFYPKKTEVTGQYRAPKIHDSIKRDKFESTSQTSDVPANTITSHRKRTTTDSASMLAKKKKRKDLLKAEKKEKAKRAIRKKRSKKKRKERRIRYLQKHFPFLAVVNIIPFPVDDKGDELKKQIKAAFFFYFLNSTALFIIAYLVVHIIYQLTVLIAAALWGLDATWYYYDLAFNDFSPLWTRTNILFITFTGPFTALVVGLAFFFYFSKKKSYKPYRRLFFVWIAIHGLNQFFGAFASGVAFDEGFGYVPIWLYWPFGIRILVSIIMIFTLGIFGYHSTSRFLSTSNSIYRIRNENKQYFLLTQAILPAFFGSLIVYLLKLPKIFPYEVGMLTLIALATMPILFNFNAKPYVKIAKEPKNKTTIRWDLILLSFILLIGFRLLLANGVHIVLILKFAISITPL